MTDQGGGPQGGWGNNAKDESLTGWMTPDAPGVPPQAGVPQTQVPVPPPPATGPTAAPGSVAAGSYTYPAERLGPGGSGAPPVPSETPAVNPAAPGGPPPPPPPLGASAAGGWSSGPAATAPSGVWSPPQTAAAVPAGAYTIAGMGPRFAAWFVDGLVLLVVGAISMSVVAAAMGGGSSLSMLPAYQLAGVAVAMGTSFLYHVGLWTGSGRATLGMRLLGLQVGNAADGMTLTLRQASIRWIALGNPLSALAGFGALSGLVGFALLVWYPVLLISTSRDPRRMGIHDHWAGSLMAARPGRGDGGSAARSCLVIGVLLFVVLPLVSIVALVFLGGAVSDVLSTVGTSI